MNSFENDCNWLSRSMTASNPVDDPVDDPVNSPSHYMHGGVETIDIIRAMLTPEEFRGYLKGNILKYRERAPYKGKTDEDYAKAKKYYDWLREEGNNE